VKLKTEFPGADYQAIRFAEWANANKRTKGGALSNGELVAHAQAWRRAAARSSTPRWPAWFDLVTTAFYGPGRGAGDRFDMTPAHMTAPAPAELVAYYWTATGDLAVQLDDAHTVVKPLIVDASRAGYEAAARDAWNILKAEAAALPVDQPVPFEEPISRPPDDEVIAPAAESSGLGALLLLLALVAWASR